MQTNPQQTPSSSASPPKPIIWLPADHSVQENYAGAMSRALGITQIIGGSMAIICQSVLTAVFSLTGFTAVGFWSGILFILAGSFGYAAGKYRTTCPIVTYMILSIISVVCCVMTFGVTVPATFLDQHFFLTTSVMVPFLPTATAFNIILAIIGVLELVTLIWGLVLVCKVTCCGSNARTNRSVMPLQVQYINGQPCIIIPPGTSYTDPSVSHSVSAPPDAEHQERKVPGHESPPQYRSIGGLQSETV